MMTTDDDSFAADVLMSLNWGNSSQAVGHSSHGGRGKLLQ